MASLINFSHCPIRSAWRGSWTRRPTDTDRRCSSSYTSSTVIKFVSIVFVNKWYCKLRNTAQELSCFRIFSGLRKRRRVKGWGGYVRGAGRIREDFRPHVSWCVTPNIQWLLRSRLIYLLTSVLFRDAVNRVKVQQNYVKTAAWLTRSFRSAFSPWLGPAVFATIHVKSVHVRCVVNLEQLFLVRHLVKGGNRFAEGSYRMGDRWVKEGATAL